MSVILQSKGKQFKLNLNKKVIEELPDKGVRRVRINNTLFSILFKDILGFNHLSTKKKIPNWVYSAPTGFIAGIISGYFIGDGHSRLESNGFSLNLTSLTASKDLIEGLTYLLLKLGIHHTIIKQDKKNKIKISGEEGVGRFNRCCKIDFIKKKNLKFTRKVINHPSIHTSYPPFLDKNKIKLVKNRVIQSNLYRAIKLNYGINKRLAKLAANKHLSKIIESNLFPIKIK